MFNGMLVSIMLSASNHKIMSQSSTTIFGGAGFIGQHIVQGLARQGVTLRIPTRDLDKALTLKPLGGVGQIAPFLCSLQDERAIARAVKGSDSVINLVGILFEKGRSSFQAIHVELAARLARIAREEGVKNFVHLSALGTHKASASRYAVSKAMGEEAVRAFFPDAVIMRPSIVFGAGDGFFNLFAGLSRFLPMLPLIGGGQTRFQPVYVGDVADAVCAALNNPQHRGQTYDLGGSDIYSFKDMLQLMCATINRHPALVTVPWPLAYVQAAFLQMLPNPLLTMDQVTLLKTDNVLPDAASNGLLQMGIVPTALELILPTYLDAYRAGGRLGDEQ